MRVRATFLCSVLAISIPNRFAADSLRTIVFNCSSLAMWATFAGDASADDLAGCPWHPLRTAIAASNRGLKDRLGSSVGQRLGGIQRRTMSEATGSLRSS